MRTTSDDLTEKMRQIETNLLTEFHRYGKGQQLRLHTLENRDAIVTERLAIIEERLLHLESRQTSYRLKMGRFIGFLLVNFVRSIPNESRFHCRPTTSVNRMSGPSLTSIFNYFPFPTSPPIR